MLLPRLQALLEDLPTTDEAIIRAEAFAIYYELRQEPEQAIAYRRREVELMQKLHQHIRTHKYDAKTKQALLYGREVRDLEERKAIIVALQKLIGT